MASTEDDALVSPRSSRIRQCSSLSNGLENQSAACEDIVAEGGRAQLHVRVHRSLACLDFLHCRSVVLAYALGSAGQCVFEARHARD